MLVVAVLLLGIVASISLLMISRASIQILFNMEGKLVHKLLFMMFSNVSPAMRSSDQPTVADLLEVEPLGSSLAKKFALVVSSYRIVPLLVGLAVTARFHPRWLWRFPFDRYVVWDILLLGAALRETEFGLPYVGFVTSVIVTVSAIIGLFAVDFMPSSHGSHKVGLKRVLAQALTVILGYAVLYRALFVLVPASYQVGPNSASEALLFSFTNASFSNVPGPMPHSLGLKFLVVSESIFVFSFATIFLGLYLPRWAEAQKEILKIRTKDLGK